MEWIRPKKVRFLFYLPTVRSRTFRIFSTLLMIIDPFQIRPDFTNMTRYLQLANLELILNRRLLSSFETLGEFCETNFELLAQNFEEMLEI